MQSDVSVFSLLFMDMQNIVCIVMIVMSKRQDRRDRISRVSPIGEERMFSGIWNKLSTASGAPPTQPFLRLSCSPPFCPRLWISCFKKVRKSNRRANWRGAGRTSSKTAVIHGHVTHGLYCDLAGSLLLGGEGTCCGGRGRYSVHTFS